MATDRPITWVEFLSIPKWAPLCSLPWEASRLTESIVRFGPTVYGLLTPYADKTLEVRPGGPFISSLLWCGSDGAALKAIMGSIESDDVVCATVPHELLPPLSGASYSGILSGLQRSARRGVNEKAVYRIAKDGAFIHKVIDCDLATYCFRKREIDGIEEPYAIIWKFLGVDSGEPNRKEPPDPIGSARMFAKTGERSFSFSMNQIIGQGFTAGGKELVQTTNVTAVFRNGNLYTLYPLLSPLK